MATIATAASPLPGLGSPQTEAVRVITIVPPPPAAPRPLLFFDDTANFSHVDTWGMYPGEMDYGGDERGYWEYHDLEEQPL